MAPKYSRDYGRVRTEFIRDKAAKIYTRIWFEPAVKIGKRIRTELTDQR